MIEIAPSILAADFSRLGEEIRAVKAGGAALVHVDVMDGHFVPSLTVGPLLVASLRKATDLLLDCHLMIEHPDAHIQAFVDAGADMISVHQEACVHLDRTLNFLKSSSVEAGVVINPATPVESLSEVLELVDYVLVMSVNPGFGGQKFIPRSIERIRHLADMRARKGLKFRIEVDGGITEENVQEVVRAGVTMIVAGSSIFHSGDPRQAVERMLKLAGSATLSRI